MALAGNPGPAAAAGDGPAMGPSTPGRGARFGGGARIVKGKGNKVGVPGVAVDTLSVRSSSEDEDEDGLGPKSTTQRPTVVRMPEVTHVVTDVDGTLLNSRQELTIRTEVAIARAAACGVPVILATGKSRGPWAEKILPKLPIPMPGVFIQGLLVCDADGTVLESIELDRNIAKSIVAFADRTNRTLVAFCGDRILCAARNADTDRVLDYGEPVPEPVGSLVEGCVDAGVAVNKLLLFAPEEDMPAIREEAEALFDQDCSITTAVPGMLEFLPKGASKGAAVARVLERLGVNAANVMALGDGENDVEMLALAGTSVAMAGSGPKVVEAAGNNVGLSNDENGVADAIERYVLINRGLAPAGSVKTPEDDEEADVLEAKVYSFEDEVTEEDKGPVEDTEAQGDPAEVVEVVAAAVEEEDEDKADEEKDKEEEEQSEEVEVEARAEGGEEAEQQPVAAEAEAKAEEEEEEEESVEVEVEAAAEEYTKDVEVEVQVAEAAAIGNEEAAAVEIDSAMLEAKRMNEELLQASKAASARLARLKGSLAETEQALKAREAEEAESRTQQARKAKEAEEAESRFMAAQAKSAMGGWGDSTEADSWEDRAANEQAAAVAAAAEAADKKAAAAAAAAEDAMAASSAAKPPEQTARGKPSWGSIGGFFTAALKTVSALTSPEARAKQAEAERAGAKANLLGAIVSTDIGRDCSAEQLSAIEAAIRQLEALNPTSSPCKSNLMKGRWSAVFTNSRELLGLDKKVSLVRQSGPVYMAHDMETGRSEVQFTWPVKVDRAELKVQPDGYNLAMTFEQTRLFGFLPLPGQNKDKEYSRLEVTYLDLDMKLCRGLKGTVYVFVQTDTNYKIGDTSSANVNKRLKG